MIYIYNYGLANSLIAILTRLDWLAESGRLLIPDSGLGGWEAVNRFGVREPRIKHQGSRARVARGEPVPSNAVAFFAPRLARGSAGRGEGQGKPSPTEGV